MIDVAQIQRDFNREAPPQLRTVRVAKAVALETRAWAEEAIDAITHSLVGSTFGSALVLGPFVTWLGTAPQLAQVRQELEDLAEIIDRIDNVYLPALVGRGPDEPVPAAVDPLLRNVSGVGFMTPEYLGPPSILNQFDQLSIVNGRLAREWRDSVFEATSEAAAAAAQTAGEVVKAAGLSIPWGGIIAGGVLVGVAFAWSRRR